MRVQGFRQRWQEMCSPTQLRGQSLLLALCNPPVNRSNRSVWSCWRLSPSPPTPRGWPSPYRPKPSLKVLKSSLPVVRQWQWQFELSPHHPVHVPQPWPGGTTSRGLHHSKTARHSTPGFDQAAAVDNATVSFSHDPWQHQIQRHESCSSEVKGYWVGLDASAQTTSPEFTIPNDLIGCIIVVRAPKSMRSVRCLGQRSKLQTQWKDRQVRIAGSAASISLAQCLICVRLSSETGGMWNS
jgi:poly(rC)-binding protein 2/3/4